jgi:deoxyribodipyrimidine photolyase
MAADLSPALWRVRRDLRLGDNPALQAAIQQDQGVLPLFVLDPADARHVSEGNHVDQALLGEYV